MKNYIRIISASMVIIIASCTDLKEEPIGLLSPEGYYKSMDDVKAMINGAYGVMASSNYYGNALPSMLQLLSDMVDNGYEYSDYAELSPFTFTPTNSYMHRVWGVSYQTIAIANSALEALEIINEPDENRRQRYIGEARFIRGFIYYHLVRLFGDIPYIVNSKLGDDLLELKRMPANDVYDRIIEDLTYAYDNLAMGYQGGVRSRPSKGAASAYLASVYMTLENWQESYDYAKWVIDNAGALGYALEDDFQNLFRAEKQADQNEYIFIMDFTGNVRGDNPNPFTLENDQLTGAFNGINGADKPLRGWSMLVPRLNIYTEWDPNDYRKKVSFEDSIIMRDGTGMVRPYTEFKWPTPHIAKWNRFAGEEKSSTAGWRSDLDYPTMRYAEVLLIAAEAANELGNTAEAVGYVNQIRARARQGGVIDYYGNGYGSYGPSSVPADIVGIPSQSEFREIVLEERRVELAFEFKRWYDIVRRDLGDQVFGSSGRESQPNFNKSKHYLLPIPQSEIDLNPNLSQNPGY